MIVSSSIGIIIAFMLLILGAYKKISMFLIAVISASAIALLSGFDISTTLLGTFRNGFMNFVGSWIVVMSLGALIAKIYTDSGAAWRISDTLINKAGTKWSLIIYILVGGFLVYGGIQPTVAIFVLLPFAKVIFKKAGIPWYLFPGITILSIATFAMGMLPGSLQVQNVIPTRLLNTSLMAAPVEGILATSFNLIIGLIWLQYHINKGKDTPEADIKNYKIETIDLDEETLDKKSPNFIISILPMLISLILINIVRINLIYGLSIGCIIGLILFRKSMSNIKDLASNGFNDGVLPTIIIASVVGVGSVIGTTPVFSIIQENIIHIPIPGLAKIGAITTIIAGITGSASGGLTMALELFGEQFINLGYPHEIIHRVASIACGGFDTVPWNGAVVTLFALSGVSYQKGYLHVAVESVILPLLSLIPVFIYYALTH